MYGQRLSTNDITWLRQGRYGIFYDEPLDRNRKVYKGNEYFNEHQWRSVAIKAIQRRNEHVEEVAFASQLQHANIVHVFDSLSDHHSTYIVMELCSENLCEYVNANHREPWYFGKAFTFSKQILDGLEYLQGMRIDHIDLKPGNILISPDGNSAKVADFGVSREEELQGASGHGSDEYRVSEILRQSSEIAFAAQIFSYGAVVFFLFTQDLSSQDRDMSIISQHPEIPSAKREQLVSLLRKALKNEPLDRPSAQDLQQDFLVMMEGSAPESKTPLAPATDESNELQQALDIAHHNLISKPEEAEESIQNLRGVLSLYGRCSGEKARKIGDNYDKGDTIQRVKALILYRIAFEQYEQENHEPDESATWMMNLARDIKLPAYELAKNDDSLRRIAIGFGAFYVEALIAAIRKIQNASHEVKLLAEAKCLWHLGNIYFRAANYEASIQYLEDALGAFVELKEENAFEDEHYCISLWVLGNANYRLTRFEEAAMWYAKTIVEVEKTDQFRLDWGMIALRDKGKAERKHRSQLAASRQHHG